MSAKEAMIYTSEFLTSLSFTILASFYPGIAESKGIPIWMIGLIFSVDPILGLPTSILSGKYMNRFGRKKILTIGLFLGGLGTGLIGMIEFGSRNQTILISLISRLLAGIGAGMSMTASSAILVIDYPKEIDRVIGWFEAASGLGLLLGPIVGSLLNLYNISVTFSIFGFGFVGFAGYVQRYLDHDKTVVEDTKGLPLVKLISKPKLFIDFAAQMLLIMSLGYLSTTIELHLRSYGISEGLVGIVYSICLFVYFVASVLESQLLRCFSGKFLTLVGISGTALGFLLIGDKVSGVDDSIFTVSAGLGILGLGGALMYIPTTSNIIHNAVEVYHFENDESLVDSVSCCTIFICNLGEIVGPILAGVLTDYLGFSSGFIIMAFFVMAFWLVYFLVAFKGTRQVGDKIYYSIE